MAFRIETGARIDDMILRDGREPIACDCWFTSKGATIPRFLKYQDSEACIHTISDIEVIDCEDQFFAGKPLRVYNCRTVVENQSYCFKLFFYVDKFKWEILWI